MNRLLKFETIHLILLLLSAILSLKAFRQRWPKPYRVFATMLLWLLLTETLTRAWKWWLFKMFSPPYAQNNHWIYNPFIAIRFGSLAVFFYLVLDSIAVKKVITILAPLILAFCIVNYFFIEGYFIHNVNSTIATHLPVIALCLIYFNQLLKDNQIIVLHKEPLVWLTLGTFFYHTASLPFLITLPSLTAESVKDALDTYFINDVLNIIMTSLYLTAFLCKPYPTQLR